MAKVQKRSWDCVQIVYTNRTKLSDLDLYECGTEDCSPLHSWGPAVRSAHVIHYIRAGKGKLRVRDRLYHLEEGEGFLLCPGVVSSYQADEKTPWHYSWVAFHGTKAQAFLKQAGLSLKQPVFGIAGLEAVWECFGDMMLASRMRHGRELYLTGLLYKLLSIQIEAHSSRQPFQETQDRTEHYIDVAVRFIQANYSRDISVGEIASQVGLDPKYLSSLFKERLDISPYKFLMATRVDRASEMLSNEALSIGDIARSVGYTDPLLFSRMFRKLKGTSPREFRKSVHR